ncbi:hypothetical protein FQR65_LT18404 [Abscondita terminalis]|nr:hypothetical protein FQR65_LT01671 [Abscondita terminalis]KAF5307448.1 hypothetical protein FQR65_LT18404 [Abscondita terminalis]
MVLLSSVFSKKIPNQVSEVWAKLTDPHLLSCVDSPNANLEPFKNMLKHIHVPNNPKFHNFIKCIYEKLEMLQPDGNFNEEIILKKATYMTPELTRKCVQKSNSEKHLPKKSFILCDCVVNGLVVD